MVCLFTHRSLSQPVRCSFQYSLRMMYSQRFSVASNTHECCFTWRLILLTLKVPNSWACADFISVLALIGEATRVTVMVQGFRLSTCIITSGKQRIKPTFYTKIPLHRISRPWSFHVSNYQIVYFQSWDHLYELQLQLYAIGVSNDPEYRIVGVRQPNYFTATLPTQ